MNHTSDPRSAWSASARAALLNRWTLLSNHVLRAETQATERLKLHAGRTVSLDAPPLPSLGRAPGSASVGASGSGFDLGMVIWQVTAAGLLERAPDAKPGDVVLPADTRVTWRTGSLLSAVRALAAGDASVFDVQGDDPLAADVRWVLDNVRWDVAADVGRVLPGPLQAPAARAAEVVAQGMKRGAQALEAWWPRTPVERPPQR